jgi:CRP-like cAMP-binding protein
MKPEELERNFSPGQLIVERGAETAELYIVRAGSVVLDRGNGGEPRLLGPGQVFGELGAVLGEPSPYRVEADDDVTVLALESGVLNQLCSENQEFALRLIQHMAEELATAHSDRGGIGGVDQRLAHGFKRLVPVLFDCAAGDEPPMPVQGRLSDLASQAGLDILEAYYCVQRLLESRTLRLVDDQLAIVEPLHLEQLLGGD